MLILDDLWEGKVHPGERYVHRGGEYARIHLESVQCLRQLLDSLDTDEKELFDTWHQKSMELTIIDEREIFIRGVRIGAKLLLDMLGDEVPVGEGSQP